MVRILPRLVLFLLLIILISMPSSAQVLTLSGPGGYGGGGGGPDVWYWTDAVQGDGGYTSSSDYIPVTYINSNPIVITSAGSITQAALKIATYGGTPSTCAVQLYNSSLAKITGATASITINATGWMSGNIATPYSASSSETIYMAIICDSQNGSRYGRDASGNGQYLSGQTYPTFPGTLSGTGDGIDYGFKIYVD